MTTESAWETAPLLDYIRDVRSGGSVLHEPSADGQSGLECAWHKSRSGRRRP